jgi:hypothetical protein
LLLSAVLALAAAAALLLQGCYTSVEHQYNATYFSATKEDPQMYLMAR